MVSRSIAITCAQLNSCVGDIEGNGRLIRDAWIQADREGADLLIMPELMLSGYPAEDLAANRGFMLRIQREVCMLLETCGSLKPAVLLTTPWLLDGALVNAALVIEKGGIRSVIGKQVLPNYGVFDEKRVFSAPGIAAPIMIGEVKFGLLLCEDGWHAELAQAHCRSGAHMLISLNASPYSKLKRQNRLAACEARVRETGLPLLYLNSIGGQDELVFDGASFALNPDGEPAMSLPHWQTATATVNAVCADAGTWRWASSARCEPPDALEDLYSAMVLGLRDYVGKNRFPGVLLGLSGGIDSALVAAIATDALGPERVVAVMLPSRYTSEQSRIDAASVAERLGIKLSEIPIDPAHRTLSITLAQALTQPLSELTEQNLQARIRGIKLMALSNQSNYLLLSTGNKSEIAVGYSTLYGDMCGGFNPLKDLYKMDVYRVSAWRNSHRPPIGLGPPGQVVPDSVLQKAPTAELKPDQKDEDNLPPYALLDTILHGLIEEELTLDELQARDIDRQTLVRVWTLLERAEFKRRQAPPGVKLSERALSRDRRYPITNRFLPSIEYDDA
ncbi:NH(3)-dependent NAD(+) synthetase [Paraburkholderia bryophila]|uniref:Glutamine-dependent NAD(+) synthetase n=2 Tax=Paraburkholderia bryophila TaxID=420952 RepID=A0A329B535_9BURK|nr:NH(3)-dependent NAD(+) synthetase [Paraburkholderia bryophila]